MIEEHPFAPYIRILGKGPNMSRSLTQDEAFAAARMVLAGEVEPIQLGAFLCLLRVKTESPEEVAGIVRAARATMPASAGVSPADLDWPTYAGKSRRQPWFLVAARLLAARGVRVLLHGSPEHAPDRLHTEACIDALSIPKAASLSDAAQCLAQRAIAYLPLDRVQPRLGALLALRSVLGVRSPINTVLRQLNPLAAPYQLVGVAHPPYRDVHRAAAALLGQPNAAIFKGEGGEAERRPEKPCDVLMLHDAEMRTESFPVAWTGPRPAFDAALDPRRLAAAWAGTDQEPLAIACIVGTAAIALRLLGRAPSPAAAETLAAARWAERLRAHPFAA